MGVRITEAALCYFEVSASRAAKSPGIGRTHIQVSVVDRPGQRRVRTPCGTTHAPAIQSDNRHQPFALIRVIDPISGLIRERVHAHYDSVGREGARIHVMDSPTMSMPVYTVPVIARKDVFQDHRSGGNISHRNPPGMILTSKDV